MAEDDEPHVYTTASGRELTDEDIARMADEEARQWDLDQGGALSRARRFGESGDVSILTEGLDQSEPEAVILALAGRLVYVETQLQECSDRGVRLGELATEASDRWKQCEKALRNLVEQADSYVAIGHALGGEDAKLVMSIARARMILAGS